MNKYLEKAAAISKRKKTETQPGMKKPKHSKQFMKLKVKIDSAPQRKKHVK